jgi:hypothetical protein
VLKIHKGLFPAGMPYAVYQAVFGERDIVRRGQRGENAAPSITCLGHRSMSQIVLQSR